MCVDTRKIIVLFVERVKWQQRLQGQDLSELFGLFSAKKLFLRVFACER